MFLKKSITIKDSYLRQILLNCKLKYYFWNLPKISIISYYISFLIKIQISCGNLKV
jgi:hypothetical protein